MNNAIFPQTDSFFQANQIICLEHDNTCVYGEVIQIIAQRQLCWFRPLFLTTNCQGDLNSVMTEDLVDLRSGSDLLLPICLFRDALDTETICLLSKFYNSDKLPKDNSISCGYLNQFVRQVWQANQDKFIFR